MAAENFQMVYPVQNRVSEGERFVVFYVTIDSTKLTLGCLWDDVIVVTISTQCVQLADCIVPLGRQQRDVICMNQNMNELEYAFNTLSMHPPKCLEHVVDVEDEQHR